MKRRLTVGRVIGTLVLASIIIALLIYTASRTVDFLQKTFPPDMQYVAYLALAAFDGGIIGWTIFATVAAEGAIQRGISYLMIFICAIGVILTTVADTILVSSQAGLTKQPPYMTTVGIWGSIAVIVINVLAGIVVHLASPHHTRKYELENVYDEIHQLTMEHIKASASIIAPQLAAEGAEHWVRTTIQQTIGGLPHNNRQLPQGQPKVVDATAASRSYTVDQREVQKRVATQKAKKLEKKPLFDFSLPKFVKGKGQEQEIEMSTPEEDYGEVYEEEIEENIPAPEDEEATPEDDDIEFMNKSIDQRWQEYSSVNTAPVQPQQKGRGGKKAKKQVDQAE